MPENGQTGREDCSDSFCVLPENRRGIAQAAMRIFCAATACLIVLPLTGCGTDSKGDVAHWSGEVTLDGKPLPDDAEGSITFRSMGAGGGQAVTVRVENGHYDSPQTPKGKVIAYFDINRPTGRTYHSERVGKDVQETKSIVPEEHLQGIEFDVTEDKSDASIDL